MDAENETGNDKYFLQTTSESQDNDADEATRIELERKDRDKIKTLKKKARKIKQKLLATRNNKTASDNRIPIDALLYPGANKMYKVVQQISNILSPLMADQKPSQNGDTDEHKTEKQETKVNGDISKEEKARGKSGNKINGNATAEEKGKPVNNINGDE